MTSLFCIKEFPFFPTRFVLLSSNCHMSRHVSAKYTNQFSFLAVLSYHCRPISSSIYAAQKRLFFQMGSYRTARSKQHIQTACFFSRFFSPLSLTLFHTYTPNAYTQTRTSVADAIVSSISATGTYSNVDEYASDSEEVPGIAFRPCMLPPPAVRALLPALIVCVDCLPFQSVPLTRQWAARDEDQDEEGLQVTRCPSSHSLLWCCCCCCFL